MPMFTEGFFAFAIRWASIGIGILLFAAILLGLHELIFVGWALTHRATCPDTDKRFRYGIIIPARNESKVISNIFNSLEKQTYDSSLFDVYVVVEDENDPTVKMALERGYNYVVRTELEGRRRKGYAVDDAYQYIKKTGKTYDAFIIFDADNILDEHFIEELNKLKATGVQAGSGYRRSTNANRNWIAATSTLLFTIMYSIDGKGKARFIKKVNICGTGFFLDASILEKEGGFIWHTLTEDAEFTKYCYANSIECGFNENAIFYDEQPHTVKMMRAQHIRWIGGFRTIPHKYGRQVWGNIFHNRGRKFSNYTAAIDVLPLIFIVAGLALYGITMIILGGLAAASGSYNGWSVNYGAMGLGLGISAFFWLATIMFIVCIITCIRERKNLQFKPHKAIIASLMFSIYFLDFLPAIPLSFRKKNKEWRVIEHDGKVTAKGAKNAKRKEK